MTALYRQNCELFVHRHSTMSSGVVFFTSSCFLGQKAGLPEPPIFEISGSSSRQIPAPAPISTHSHSHTYTHTIGPVKIKYLQRSRSRSRTKKTAPAPDKNAAPAPLAKGTIIYDRGVPSLLQGIYKVCAQSMGIRTQKASIIPIRIRNMTGGLNTTFQYFAKYEIEAVLWIRIQL